MQTRIAVLMRGLLAGAAVGTASAAVVQLHFFSPEVVTQLVSHRGDDAGCGGTGGTGDRLPDY